MKVTKRKYYPGMVGAFRLGFNRGFSNQDQNFILEGHFPSKYLEGYFPSKYLEGHFPSEYLEEHFPSKSLEGHFSSKSLEGYFSSKFLEGHFSSKYLEGLSGLEEKYRGTRNICLINPL